ncbi:MAG: radical SAM protein [Candidatus Aminicenantes bacterium]|nr:radical SAM protein [Candidatus Aminicenantes bacterium]
MKPLVFDIARASGVDGPGLRTVVFLKGCPLRCEWCQNPESQDPAAENLFYAENCIKCGCCDQGCYSLARQTAGRYYSPPELARLILRDKIVYQVSSGGVTFSGGEPLMFIDYLYETAQILKQENIHIAVETCGYFDFQSFEKTLLPLIDLFLFDVKLMDPVRHEIATGKSNHLIIRNFKKLCESGLEVIPRVPLIPGYTASRENLSQIAAFFVEQGVADCAFLPYNPSGIDKWARLGKQPPANLSPIPMHLEEEQAWIAFFNRERENKKSNLLHI